MIPLNHPHNRKRTPEDLKVLYAEQAKLSELLSTPNGNIAFRVFACRQLDRIDREILTLQNRLASQGRH